MPQAIDLVVAARHLPGVNLVLVDQGLEDVVDLADRQLAHQPELRTQRLLRQRHERARHAGDAHRIVAHPLELGGDVLDAHEVPQVAGHRLLRRDDHEDLLANLAKELVQVLVLGAHLFGRHPVAPAEGVESGLDLGLDQRAHPNQRFAKARQLSFER
jgi:hypothetical protein